MELKTSPKVNPKAKAPFDFSGYVTRYNVKCQDGRTIESGAFDHCGGNKVPLVWSHKRDTPEGIIGHVMLEKRADGIYGRARLNSSDYANTARECISHGDIDEMSVHANQLTHRGDVVVRGDVREVSLVVAGANPGAFIDNLTMTHGDITTIIDTEAYIRSGEFIHTGEDMLEVISISHAAPETNLDDATVGSVLEALTQVQKDAVAYALTAVADGSMSHSENNEGDPTMKKNVFDKIKPVEKPTHLTHDAFQTIMANAKVTGSLKAAFLDHVSTMNLSKEQSGDMDHAATYGIDNLEVFFPDAVAVTRTPDEISRNTDWVSKVLNGAKHTPFSRIKSTTIDLTADAARARGYIKGNVKVEEVIVAAKRTTTPCTIYKKQKLDRDDIIDVTTLDIVALLWKEMRMMLDEELARAMLVGDGRAADSDDKIPEANIRPIWTDVPLYSMKTVVDHAATTQATMDSILRAMDDYEGSGNITFFTHQANITDMLLVRDTEGRRIYRNKEEVASALGVDRLQAVPIMKNLSRTPEGNLGVYDLFGIAVDMRDYTIGADKGGKLAMFDDFDLNVNQFLYLMETRMSAALCKPMSAVVIEKNRAPIARVANRGQAT